MKLATLRTPEGTRAARIDEAVARAFAEDAPADPRKNFFTFAPDFDFVFFVI